MPSEADQIDAFLAGTLDESTTAAFVERLEQDRELRDELAWGMLIEGLLAEAPAEQVGQRRPIRTIIGLAAAVLLTVAAGLWLTLGTAAKSEADPRLRQISGAEVDDGDPRRLRLTGGDTATLAWPDGKELRLDGPGSMHWTRVEDRYVLHSTGGRVATANGPAGLAVATPQGRLHPDANATWSLQIGPQHQVVQVQRGSVRYLVDADSTPVGAGSYAIFANRSLQQQAPLLVAGQVWARWDCAVGQPPIGCRGPATPLPLRAIASDASSAPPPSPGLRLGAGQLLQSAPRPELAGILGGGATATGGTIACWIRAGDWPQLPDRLLLARIHADDERPRQLNWALNRSILATLAQRPERDHHIVLRIAPSGDLTTYFNGARGTAGALEAGRPLPTTCRLSLGPGATETPIVLRQVAIWTVPLDPARISELHRAGPDGWCLPDFGLR